MLSIGVIDFGYGNIPSVVNALNYLSIPNKVISDPSELDQFNKIILPGVGAFNQAILTMEKRNWKKNIQDFALDKKNNILGICLGMQLLFESSEENGFSEGLGLINGECKKFCVSDNLSFPIPHIGFSEVSSKSKKLLNEIPDNTPFYFVHSYRINMDSADKYTGYGTTQYSEKFISLVEKDNIFGTQFHPEKSHKAGLKILQNFYKL